MNPYNEFKKWLCDGNINSELNQDVLKIINPLSIMGMFLDKPDVSIYLNDTYNKFTLFKYNKYEFFKFIKEGITNNKMTNPYGFSYITLKTKKKEQNDKIWDIFPYIKNYECNMLSENLNEDDEIEDFLNTLKESKVKKSRKKKNDE